ncbi:hypothetical protein K523DRAFT_325496 [Schizophyllum commune Tattone D]|nr:hypothetical protein K523DRAFT_325496 [Schizophyllum commune Tattone D]
MGTATNVLFPPPLAPCLHFLPPGFSHSIHMHLVFPDVSTDAAAAFLLPSTSRQRRHPLYTYHREK